MGVVEDRASIEAIAAYLAASERAIESAVKLQQAWRAHFESGGVEPSTDWIEAAATDQKAADFALAGARTARTERAVAPSTGPVLEEVPAFAVNEAEPIAFPGELPWVSPRRRRKRRSVNRFLQWLGRPGQKILRGLLLFLLLVFALVIGGSGISLSLEVAGYLHLIEDPVQLPLATQLGIFFGALVVFAILRRLLRPVDRALFGSKQMPRGTFPLRAS